MTSSRIRSPNSRRSRLPVFSRASAEQLPPLQIRQRDREIIRAVYEYRALTSRLVELLFFRTPELLAHPPAAGRRPPKKLHTRCSRRLQKLYHHGYLARFEQATTRQDGPKPFIYMLDRRGAERLSQDAGEPVDWKPAHNDVARKFQEHLLLTNAFRACVVIATEERGFTLHNWIDDADLKRRQRTDYVRLTGPQGGQPKKIPFLPDGYFLLEDDNDYNRCVVEVDRATIVGQASRWGRRDWATRVRAYNEFVDSGRFSKRFRGRGMRVLTITTSEPRMRNLIRVTRQAGGRNRWWFTTFDQVSPATVLEAPIWHLATGRTARSLVG